jgi:hypothetical protein
VYVIHMRRCCDRGLNRSKYCDGFTRSEPYPQLHKLDCVPACLSVCMNVFAHI